MDRQQRYKGPERRQVQRPYEGDERRQPDPIFDEPTLANPDTPQTQRFDDTH